MESNRFKALVLALVLTLTATYTHGQTWSEFFQQKKTQTKYLLEQIAALKMYAGYAKKGYDIASIGLNTVRDFSKGEFNLHNSFISSLKNVSPVIRNNTKVAEIIILQIEIAKSFRNIRNSGSSTTTSAYVETVRANVLERCSYDLEELLLVITSGKVEMQDDERLQRLDRIYESMLEKSAFVQSFSNQINLVNQQRDNEQRSINQLRQFYESNN
jgi:hypothetical protein